MATGELYKGLLELLVWLIVLIACIVCGFVVHSSFFIAAVVALIVFFERIGVFD